MEVEEIVSTPKLEIQNQEICFTRPTLVECVENFLKKGGFNCSEHEKDTAIFCFTCKQSICAACREFNHYQHFCLNKVDYNLDELEKNPERFLCTKIEGENFEMMNMYKDRIEQDFMKIQNSIEAVKQDRLKEIELYFLNFESFKNNLREDIKKSIDAFICFCESYRGILTREAIKLNDASFLQMYDLLIKGASTNKQILNLVTKKREELNTYFENIKDINERFEKTIHENLGHPLLFSVQNQFDKLNPKLVSIHSTKEQESNSEKQVEASLNYNEDKFKKSPSNNENLEKLCNPNCIGDLQEYLRLNCNFLENFIKEVKTVRNINTLHCTNTMSRKPEINLTGIPDSKLYTKAYLKFLQTNGEGLENLVNQLSIYPVIPIFKESRTRSLSNSKKLRTSSKSPNPNKKKTSLWKNTTLSKKITSGKKEVTINLNKFSESREGGENSSDRMKGNKIFLLRDSYVGRDVISPMKTTHMDKRKVSESRDLVGVLPAPLKSFNRDDLLFNLQNKSKSSYKNKNSKNQSPSKRDGVSNSAKRDGDPINNSDSMNNSDTPRTKNKKLRSKISDHLIKILMSSNIKLKNDPIKLINQYLAANSNLTQINDLTIKNIMDQIFNNDSAKPVEGKNEIQLYDFKNSKINKKEINLTKSTHGFTSFLNGLRYTILKDKLYIIGGRDWSQEYTSCLCYDIKSENITRIADMNKPRAYCSIITSEDERFIYAIGGEENNTCEVYNIETGTWTALPRLNFARGNPYLYIYKGQYLYVFSGFKGGISGNQFQDHIERLNLMNPKSWELMQYKNSSLIDMRFPYSGVIPITVNHILIYGDENSRYHKKCQVIYDLTKNEIFKAEDKLETIRKVKLTDLKSTGSIKV